MSKRKAPKGKRKTLKYRCPDPDCPKLLREAQLHQHLDENPEHRHDRTNFQIKRAAHTEREAREAKDAATDQMLREYHAQEAKAQSLSHIDLTGGDQEMDERHREVETGGDRSEGKGERERSRPRSRSPM